jgi:hypothetical protein
LIFIIAKHIRAPGQILESGLPPSLTSLDIANVAGIVFSRTPGTDIFHGCKGNLLESNCNKLGMDSPSNISNP